jgi:hypothetical protein
MADKKQFSNTKSIVKVETGIVTLISYHHYLKIVGNNKKCRTDRRVHAFKFSDGYKSTMDWWSVYLSPQALPKYIYLSPPLIFPTTSTELGQKTARCESLWALLHYVEWDRIATLAGSKSGLRVTLSSRFGDIHIWIDCRTYRSKSFPYLAFRSM